MDFSIWIAYFIAVSTLIIIPGPMAINQIRLATFNPAKKCIWSAFGGTTISNMYVGLVFLFISHISQYADLISFIQIVGAGYLLVLAIKTWNNSKQLMITKSQLSPLSNFRLFVSGASVALSNIKDIMFFVSFLPLFIINFTFVEYLMIAITWTILDVSSMLAYSTFSSKLCSINNRFAGVLSAISAFGLAFISIVIMINYVIP